MSKKGESVLVFEDKMLFVEGLILMVATSVLCVWILYLTTLPTSSSLTEVWLCRILFSGMGLSLLLILLLNSRRYFAWYRFSSEGITCYMPFHRKKLLPYSAFPYVMHGRYFHIAYWRDYIIFANRRLTSAELNQINLVVPSDTLLKVKCSEKTCRTLMAVLPVRYRGTVAAALRDD